MNYRLKQDLGLCKKGDEVFTTNDKVVLASWRFHEDEIAKLIEQNIIEPIEVPTWTDSQMIDNMEEYANHLSSDTDCGYLTASQWLKRKLNRLKSKQEEGI